MVHRLRVRGALALVCLLSLSGSLWGRRVVALNGTYDFDGDGLSEFLSIEKPEPGDPYEGIAAFTEIDEAGSHVLLWAFTTPLPLIDARIADMDGNGAPEVVVLTGNSLETDGTGRYRLHWFPWDDESFSENPVVQWAGDPSTAKQKAFGFTVIDIDNDSRDEIALSLGSPNREILLLALDPTADPPLFEISRTLTSPALSSGYGQIFLSTVDENGDGFWDLMALMRELSTLKVQLFANDGGALVEGSSYESDISKVTPRFSGLVQSGINTFDIDRDGTDEVFLPFKSGTSVALKLSSGQLNVVPVEVEVASLFSLPATGIEESIINEILLERAESGITGRRARKLELRATRTEVPAAAVQETVAVATPAPAARKVKRLQLTAVQDTTSTEAAPGGTVDTTALSPAVEPAAPGRVRKLDLTTLEKEPEAPAPAAIPPPDVTATDTVTAGETFSRALEPDETRRLHAFKPFSLPPGAYFDPPTRAVLWTPSEDQVGIHRLAYQVEFEVAGERVNVEEVEGTGVQVLSTTETDTVELYILVESKEEP